MNPVTKANINFVRTRRVRATEPGGFSIWHIEAEAVGSRYDIIADYDELNRRLVVSLVNFQVCWQFNSPVHWDYVSDKLNLPRPDAQAMAIIINEIHEEIRAWPSS